MLRWIKNRLRRPAHSDNRLNGTGAARPRNYNDSMADLFRWQIRREQDRRN